MTGQLFCTWRRHIHMYTIVLCRHVLCIYVLLLADIHITSMMGTENKQDVTAKIHPQVSDESRTVGVRTAVYFRNTSQACKLQVTHKLHSKQPNLGLTQEFVVACAHAL